MPTANKRPAAEKKMAERRAERDFCPAPVERAKAAPLPLTDKQWQRLRTAVAADDQETFEKLVDAVAKQIARDLLVRRAGHYRQGAYVGGRPYCVLDR